MRKWRLNMLLLAVVAGAAPIALTPGTAEAGIEGGTCCPGSSGACYLNLGGTIIRESPAWYQSGGPCPG
ncbi:MAG TPA: hypothetical protein VLK84_07075 [Longimicrobium sp.]|nr:hypothetical protein [Longimicrobium sp.]